MPFFPFFSFTFFTKTSDLQIACLFSCCYIYNLLQLFLSLCPVTLHFWKELPVCLLQIWSVKSIFLLFFISFAVLPFIRELILNLWFHFSIFSCYTSLANAMVKSVFLRALNRNFNFFLLMLFCSETTFLRHILLLGFLGCALIPPNSASCFSRPQSACIFYVYSF